MWCELGRVPMAGKISFSDNENVTEWLKTLIRPTKIVHAI